MHRRRPGQGAGERGLEGIAPALVKHLPTVTRAWVKATDADRAAWLDGEAGEKRAAQTVVREVIGRIGGELVSDVEVPRENIDLVAVLPTGLFVVEVKHWSGTATLKGDVIFHGGRQPRSVHAQVERQRAKLAAMLRLDVDIEGVIVLVPKGELRVKGNADPATTPVVMLTELAAFLRGARMAPRPTVLAPHEVKGIATWIRYGGPVPIKVAAHPDFTATPPECPRCGEPMVERSGKRGPFLGCSRFPACGATRDLEAVDPHFAARRRRPDHAAGVMQWHRGRRVDQ